MHYSTNFRSSKYLLRVKAKSPKQLSGSTNQNYLLNTWTERTSGTSKYFRGVTYGNELFVTVSLGGTILTSSDGTTWTERTSGTIYNLNGVTYGNGLFVTVGESGTILTSPDGITWTERTSGTPKELYGVTNKE